jgi:hypothetical protein
VSNNWDEPEPREEPGRRFDRDDEYDRREPRSRRRYNDERDDYDEFYGRPDPAQKVNAPALSLMIVGWLGVLVSIGLIGLGVWMTAMIANGPGNPGDEVTGIVLALSGVLSVVACMVIAIGGHRMRQFRSWGLCMTAAVLAVASIALFGLCSVFILPFGIWALVVLNNSDVKREFDRVRQAGFSELGQEYRDDRE